MTGIGVYVLNLEKALKLLSCDFSRIEFNFHKKLKFKYFFYQLWLNFFLYLKVLFFKTNIVIFPNFIMPFIKFKGTKYITVIHDLAPFRQEEMSKSAGNKYRKGIINTLKNANMVVTVSETIRQEIIGKFNINPDKIKVVCDSVSPCFVNPDTNLSDAAQNELLRKYNIESRKYILSVATLNKRKNIPELIKAFEIISQKYSDLKLVLVGGMGNEIKEKLTLQQNVIFTGYISDEDLQILYKNALIYMYPSLYEGFGIPLIEAQYCGCPVLCSDIPVFHEVAQDSAEFCVPNAKSIAEKLEYLINNEQRCLDLIRLGTENVKRFDIKVIAEQLKKVIESE